MQLLTPKSNSITQAKAILKRLVQIEVDLVEKGEKYRNGLLAEQEQLRVGFESLLGAAGYHDRESVLSAAATGGELEVQSDVALKIRQEIEQKIRGSENTFAAALLEHERELLRRQSQNRHSVASLAASLVGTYAVKNALTAADKLVDQRLTALKDAREAAAAFDDNHPDLSELLRLHDEHQKELRSLPDWNPRCAGFPLFKTLANLRRSHPFQSFESRNG